MCADCVWGATGAAPAPFVLGRDGEGKMSEKIALGLGDNIDYEIVWDSKVFENLVVRYDIREAELNTHRAVGCERDLVVSILAFVRSGTGGERVVDSPDILERFAERFAKKITLGGTPVRAAIAMRKLGYTSALHLVTTNDHVRALIPPDSPYVCSNPCDTSYPHLIVQFAKGVTVRAGNIDLRAPKADRIIFHRNEDYFAMKLNEGFAELVGEAKVFLVSGFNAMLSESLLADRLASLQRIMARLPEDALVFLEDAGYHEPKFRQSVLRALSGKNYIFSLNADELQDYVGRKLDFLDAPEIKQALLDLRNLVPEPVIVLHTMHWALAFSREAARFLKALRAGTTMATTRFCYGDDFIADDYRRVQGLVPDEEGAAFSDALNELMAATVVCVPVAQVDQARGDATTIGLGDAFVGGFLAALSD